MRFLKGKLIMLLDGKRVINLKDTPGPLDRV